jgi:hypothetical protein
MKVKELIAELQKLDQERDIWVVYDTFDAQVPFLEVAKERDETSDGRVKAGDYVHFTS